MTESIRAATGSASGHDTAEAAEQAVTAVADGLGGASPTLAVVFVGAAHTAAADTVAERIRARLAPAHLLGMTAEAVVADDHELEDPSALSIWAATLPGATITPLRYEAPGDDAEAATGAEWALPPEDATAVVVLADPVSFPLPEWLSWLGQARPELPASGGMASGVPQPGGNRLLLDDAVFDQGAVAVAVAGMRVRTLVSQGCRPVGSSYIVTGADRNLITELGGVAPLQRLRDIYAAATPDDQARLQTGLHVGVAMDEYREELGRGDFLVRGVLGAQQGTDALVVGDRIDVGQTVQFHVRDAPSADEDLRELLADYGDDTAPAALLFTCNGRGQRLFDEPDHDARAVRAGLGGPALAGCFCAGEVGRVGSRNFMHGFTASVVSFEPAGG